MDYTPILEIGVDFLVLVITGLFAVGIAYLKKIVENSQFKESLTTTLETIDALANNVVNDISTETKKALADGKITSEERAALKLLAKDKFVNVVSPKMNERLKVHVNDTDTFITAKINKAVEDALVNIKNQ